MTYGWRPPGLLLTLVGFYGLLFAIEKMRNSAWSVALVFALTGLMGPTLGPILSLAVHSRPTSAAPPSS
jgi:modulator of FtsH protease